MFKKRKKVVAAQVVDIVGSEKPDYFRMAVLNQSTRQLLGMSDGSELIGAMTKGAYSMQRAAYNHALKYFPEGFSNTRLATADFTNDPIVVAGCKEELKKFITGDVEIERIVFGSASCEALGDAWIESKFSPDKFTFYSNHEIDDDDNTLFYAIYKKEQSTELPKTGKEVPYTDEDFAEDSKEDKNWKRPDAAIKLNIYTDLGLKEGADTLIIQYREIVADTSYSRVYVYRVGSGSNPTLDTYSFANKTSATLFWPIVPVKEEKHYFSDGKQGRHKYKDKDAKKTKEDKKTFPAYKPEIFTKANTYFRKMTGEKKNDLRTFTVALDKQGDSDKTKWGYICSAVDIGTKSAAGMAYLYNFFMHMKNIGGGNLLEFSSPVNPSRFKYEHRWSSINQIVIDVASLPDNIQTYVKKYGYLTNFSLKRLGYSIPASFSLSNLVVGKLLKNKIVLLTIGSLEYNIYVVSGKWVKKSWGDYIDSINDQSKIVLVPMHIEVLRGLSLKFKNQLCAENQFLVLTTSKTKKVWRGFFKIMIQAIGIVIGSLLGGVFGGSMFGSLASGFLGGAVGGAVGGGLFGALVGSFVNAIALVVITNALSALTGLKGFAKQMFDFVIGVLAWPVITASSLSAGLSAMANPGAYIFTAKNILDFGYNLAHGMMQQQQVNMAKGYNRKYKAAQKDYDDKMAVIEARKEELGLHEHNRFVPPTPQQVIENRCLVLQDFVNLDLQGRTRLELNYGKL